MIELGTSSDISMGFFIGLGFLPILLSLYMIIKEKRAPWKRGTIKLKNPLSQLFALIIVLIIINYLIYLLFKEGVTIIFLISFIASQIVYVGLIKLTQIFLQKKKNKPFKKKSIKVLSYFFILLKFFLYLEIVFGILFIGIIFTLPFMIILLLILMAVLSLVLPESLVLILIGFILIALLIFLIRALLIFTKKIFLNLKKKFKQDYDSLMKSIKKTKKDN